MNVANIFEDEARFTKEGRAFNTVLLTIAFAAFGVLVGYWDLIADKFSQKGIITGTFFLTYINIMLTAYLNVNTIAENRVKNKKTLLNNYSSRFSNDPSIRQVSEWLLSISKIDKQGQFLGISILDTQSSCRNDMKRPNAFDIERFVEFFIELKLQIQHNQIRKSDAKEVFSYYPILFDKVRKQEKEIFCCEERYKSFAEYIELIDNSQTAT